MELEDSEGATWAQSQFAFVVLLMQEWHCWCMSLTKTHSKGFFFFLRQLGQHLAQHEEKNTKGFYTCTCIAADMMCMTHMLLEDHIGLSDVTAPFQCGGDYTAVCERCFILFCHLFSASLLIARFLLMIYFILVNKTGIGFSCRLHCCSSQSAVFIVQQLEHE